MKINLKDALASMDYHDLVQFHEDLQKGGHSTRQMVRDTIMAKEKQMGKFCHVCQSEIDPHSVHNYTILLGPEGLRRKASFCALDCMKYFISTIEKRVNDLKERSDKEEDI
ncbi:MAG: hypothetical protein V1729_03630 [Candidatus Woesearchaeota archaeon]